MKINKSAPERIFKMKSYIPIIGIFLTKYPIKKHFWFFREVGVQQKNYKVICINTFQFESKLTLNKSYDAMSIIDTRYGAYYSLKDDNNTHQWVPLDYFITIENYRNNKLNQLGI